MTGASQRDQGDKNNKVISMAQKKRQLAGTVLSGAGTATNTRPGTGKVSRAGKLKA